MNSQRFSNMVAILIALVTVSGAIVAWRIAVATSEAGSADTTGLLAAVDKEDATTEATIYAIGHQTAYAAFLRDDSLANALYTLGGNFTDAANALEAAANRTLDYIPRAYLDRNLNFKVQRDIGENVAESTVRKDINAQPHFDAADAARARAQWLLFVLLWLGFALLLLTLADAIRNPLRYLFLLGGMSIYILGTLAATLIEALASRV